MRSGVMTCAVGALSVLLMGATAHAGPGVTHAEIGDAGDGIGGAVQVAGVTQGDSLVSITGATSSLADDFVDAYLIQIADPDLFLATTTDGTSFDTMLYLFNLDGTGLLANDDVSGSSRSTLGNASDDGTGVVVGAGQYILAVTGFQMDPADVLSQILFDIPVGDLTEVSGPDGSGGANPLAEWQDNTVLGDAETGTYTVTLRGVVVAPAPGVAGMAGAIGVGIGTRRRRR